MTAQERMQEMLMHRSKIIRGEKPSEAEIRRGIQLLRFDRVQAAGNTARKGTPAKAAHAQKTLDLDSF